MARKEEKGGISSGHGDTHSTPRDGSQPRDYQAPHPSPRVCLFRQSPHPLSRSRSPLQNSASQNSAGNSSGERVIERHLKVVYKMDGKEKAVEILKRRILVPEHRTVEPASVKSACHREKPASIFFSFPRVTFKGAADKSQKIELKLILPMGSASVPPK